MYSQRYEHRFPAAERPWCLSDKADRNCVDWWSKLASQLE